MFCKFDKLVLAACLMLSSAVSAEENTNIPSEVTLFKNLKIFDGQTDTLKEELDVLVVKNKIHKVAKDIPSARGT